MSETTGTMDVRPVRHMPSGHVMDLGRPLAEADYQLLASLHGQIGAGDNILKCESTGGDPWLHVYQHGDGYLARHFPGGGHHGGHLIIRKSDKHLRIQDYEQRALEEAVGPAAQEVSTNNRTRLDVATLDAPRISGFEVQLQDDKIPAIKARTTRSMRATAFTGRFARPLPDGVLPVWFSPDAELRRRWLYHVPTIEAPTMSWDFLPKRNTVTAIGVRQIEAGKCTPGSRWPRCPLYGGGWCQTTHPLAVLRPGLTVDAVVAMVATGRLVPLRYFTGYVYLVDPESAALYEELGGRGEYAAGNRRTSEHALGPCRNYAHDIPPPPVAPPVAPPAPAPVTPAPQPERAALPAFPVLPPRQARQWRCARCGAVTNTDPCPQCRSWRVSYVGDRLPLGACPLCAKVHSRCQFAPGSLYCMRPGCGNPHHRADPSAHRGDRTA